MCNFPLARGCAFTFCCIRQLPSSGCATSDTATTKCLTVRATFDRTPHGCVVFSSSNRSKPPLFLRFTTLAPCLYVAFHYPCEYGIFTIQLSLPVRCATSHAFLANCLADYVQLRLLPWPTETAYPQAGRGNSCTSTNNQLA